MGVLAHMMFELQPGHPCWLVLMQELLTVHMVSGVGITLVLVLGLSLVKGLMSPLIGMMPYTFEVPTIWLS